MVKSIAAGALAGTVATFLMSPLMAPRLTRSAARRLPAARPLDEFPPRRIVQVAEEHVFDRQPLPDPAEAAVTWTAHLGYGTTVGALYGALRSGAAAADSGGGRGAAAGVAFGLAVWAFGYTGWLPLFGVREGTVRGEPRDLPFPLAAHIVYGAALGIVHARLPSRRDAETQRA